MSFERRRLDELSETLRRDGGVAVEPFGIGVLGLTVAQRMKVACHPQPWDGPLYFCVPGSDGGGPCRILGRAEQVTEVAGVVLRLVRSEPGRGDAA
ncbi:hypothetical protein SMC26_39830 [Actinomadura fulvescens]|uniref:Uncharacterized protein n=1 Tax=Actinomadura fulvescens TaxID=46160 RepID=A0ABN3QYQ0_9ACTN